MSRAWIHISGLLSDLDTWSGIRPGITKIASVLNARVWHYNWNAPDVENCFDWAYRLGYREFWLSGHSHGAWKLDQILRDVNHNDVKIYETVYLDLAPLGKPNAWDESDKKPAKWPDILESGLCLYQRKQAPLAGVRFEAKPKFDVMNVGTLWNLGHSQMCSDLRVWGEISKRAVQPEVERLHNLFKE